VRSLKIPLIGALLDGSFDFDTLPSVISTSLAPSQGVLVDFVSNSNSFEK
jgi:hypothetical protein